MNERDGYVLPQYAALL